MTDADSKQPGFADSTNAAAMAFYAVAGGYCEFIETTVKTDLAPFLAKLERHLSQVLCAAVALPGATPSDRPDLTPISGAAMTPILRSLGTTLGVNDVYRQVFDPFEANERDVVAGSLSDDLGDIYRDLKRGVVEWSDAGPVGQQDIVWEWRLTFESHWGQHLLSAMRAVYWLRHRHMAQ
jgi:hypothetical protein